MSLLTLKNPTKRVFRWDLKMFLSSMLGLRITPKSSTVESTTPQQASLSQQQNFTNLLSGTTPPTYLQPGADGLIRILGSSAQDRIIFGSNLNQQSGAREFYVDVNGVRSLIRQEDLSRVRVNGKEGNDYIDASILDVNGLVLRGGQDSDVIFGSRGHDALIKGGSGLDFLRGSGGNDTIQGRRVETSPFFWFRRFFSSGRW